MPRLLECSFGECSSYFSQVRTILLSNYQFGFRPGSSTQDALLNDMLLMTGKNRQTKESLQLFSFLTCLRPLTEFHIHVYLTSSVILELQGPFNKWFSNNLTGRNGQDILLKTFETVKCVQWLIQSYVFSIQNQLSAGR